MNEHWWARADTLFFAASTLIAIFLAILPVVLTAKSSHLVFYREQKPTPIISLEDTSQFELLYTAKITGEPLKNSIYLTRGTLWNRGKAHIGGTDILQEIKFRIEGTQVEVLDAQIENVSRDVIQATSVFEGGQLTVKFNALEPKDGIRIRFAYQGSRDVKIVVDGATIGQNKIQVIDGNSESEGYFSKVKAWSPARWFFAGMLVLVLLTLFVQPYFYGLRDQPPDIEKWIKYTPKPRVLQSAGDRFDVYANGILLTNATVVNEMRRHRNDLQKIPVSAGEICQITFRVFNQGPYQLDKTTVQIGFMAEDSEIIGGEGWETVDRIRSKIKFKELSHNARQARTENLIPAKDKFEPKWIRFKASVCKTDFTVIRVFSKGSEPLEFWVELENKNW